MRAYFHTDKSVLPTLNRDELLRNAGIVISMFYEYI
jgi:hypothetical protein